MSEQRSLLERHRAVMPDWLALYYDEPISLVRGEGRHVWDADDNRYLDWFGGILTTSTAYNLPEVVQAVQAQAAKMLHTSTLYLLENQIELAEEIAALAPVDNAKVFFCNSGTEANETALMLATNMRRSNQVLALRNSYHGRSFAAMALTGNRGWRASSLSPINVSYVHNGYRYRSPFGHMPDEEFSQACADDLRNVIETTTSGDVACMIAEPIQGVGGFTVPPDGFFGKMKTVLDEYGIMFISDEVQTGWGRAGDHFWGIQAHGVRPDIMTFAKGLGNGLAVGGVIASAEVMDCVGANSISTFGGNPLSMAGSLANLRYILANNLQQNSCDVGNAIFAHLHVLHAKHALPIVGEIRGKGLMLGVELCKPHTKDPDPAAAGAVMEATKSRGLLIGKGGLYGNCLRAAPPMTMTMEEAEEGLDILVASIQHVQKEMHGIEAPVAASVRA